VASRGAKVTNFKILLFSHGVAKNAAYRLACPGPGDRKKKVVFVNVDPKRYFYKLYFVTKPRAIHTACFTETLPFLTEHTAHLKNLAFFTAGFSYLIHILTFLILA